MKGWYFMNMLEIHWLKNYPAVCLNRDDSGTPKTVVFGGVQRSRISSQCIKSAWRHSPLFHQEVGDNLISYRTRFMPQIVCDRLSKLGVSDDYFSSIMLLVGSLFKKDKSKNDNNEEVDDSDVKVDNFVEQVIPLCESDIDIVTSLIKEKIDELGTVSKFRKYAKSKVKDFIQLLKKKNVRPLSIDIALFGRMITSDGFADIDGVMQVSHPFSVNRCELEDDFYIAMDDWMRNNGENGSGMMGHSGFSSNCYYGCASLDVDSFYKTMKSTPDGDAIVKNVIPALLRTIAYANPSGKQNSYAGNVLPSLFMVEVKERKEPINYANAFVRPVQPKAESDLVDESIKALLRYVNMIDYKFGNNDCKRYLFMVSDSDIEIPTEMAKNTVVCDRFNDMVDTIKTLL